MLDAPTARALLQQTRPGRHADSYPADVRRSVVALVRGRLADGLSLNAIAGELGVTRRTLGQWVARAPAEESAFIPVVVGDPIKSPGQATSDSSPAQIAGLSGGLALLSLSGFRIDGLCLDDAIYALHQLS